MRIMDYGKFLFEQNKKAHSAKRKQKQIQVKEVKFRPGTEEADYQVKLRNLIRFLTEGDKAKVTLRFRGREMVHQDIGRKLLARVSADLGPHGRDRAEPADGGQADGHGVCTEKEVTPLKRRPARVQRLSVVRPPAGCRKAALRTVAIQIGVSIMPKLKTNRAAAKRFRKTAKGFKALCGRPSP